MGDLVVAGSCLVRLLAFQGAANHHVFILRRPKGGAIFAPTLSHVVNKTRAVRSHVDGSNHPQITNIVHAGPTIRLGGTHVRDAGTHVDS
jgi:hypothetical protein